MTTTALANFTAQAASMVRQNDLARLVADYSSDVAPRLAA